MPWIGPSEMINYRWALYLSYKSENKVLETWTQTRPGDDAPSSSLLEQGIDSDLRGGTGFKTWITGLRVKSARNWKKLKSK